MRGIRFIALAALPALAALGACEPQTDQQEGGLETDQPATQQTTPDETRTQQRTVAFADWDANGDERLDQQEFQMWWNEEGPTDEWGFEDRDELPRDELSEHVYEAWDRDDDGSVTEAEWRDGAERWFEGDVDTDAFSTWDTDGDGELSQEEFAAGIQQQGHLEQVDGDGDGMVRSQELADWYFGALDLDGDGYIDNSEWQAGEAEGLDV